MDNSVKKDPKSDSLTTLIQAENLIDLWKYFEDRAVMLKERQWTVGTWILTLLSGMLVFSVGQESLVLTQTGVTASKPFPALILGFAGLLVCIYGLGVIRSYGQHIQRNYDRSGIAQRKIVNLKDFLAVTETSKRSNKDTASKKPSLLDLPRESIYLNTIITLFLLIYLGISLLASLVLISG